MPQVTNLGQAVQGLMHLIYYCLQVMHGLTSLEEDSSCCISFSPATSATLLPAGTHDVSCCCN